MIIAPLAAQAFGAMAQEYERGRPGWPPDAVADLVERFGARTVLDLAAGTGIVDQVASSSAIGALPPGRRRPALDAVRGLLERHGVDEVTLRYKTAITTARACRWLSSRSARR